MIRVVAKSVFPAEALSKALELYRLVAKETRMEAGCVEYVIARDTKEAGVLTVIECWESRAALDAHMQTPHFTEYIPQLNALRTAAETAVYEQVI